jgi:hypothetical protein
MDQAQALLNAVVDQRNAALNDLATRASELTMANDRIAALVLRVKELEAAAQAPKE